MSTSGIRCFAEVCYLFFFFQYVRLKDVGATIVRSLNLYGSMKYLAVANVIVNRDRLEKW